MKFLIIGPKTENTHDLANEILRRNCSVDIISPRDFSFFVNDGDFLVSAEGKDLLDYDIFLLRGYNRTLTETRIFAEFLLNSGKVVVDETVAYNYIPSKLYEASKVLRAGLNYPKTFLIVDNKKIGDSLGRLEFPVVVKPVYGQKGQDINKFEKKAELIKFLSQRDSEEKFLIQEFLELDGDIRVFVVGDKVLGAIKRFVIPGDFRSNASLGSRVDVFLVDREVNDIALKSCQAMNYEVAGVDLARANGKWYVIEVNSTPQWQKFKEATGINPAKEIINHALRKYEKRKQKK